MGAIELREMRIFDVAAVTVQVAVDCTWCGAGVGRPCSDLRHGQEHAREGPHAQRWRDYWNATHHVEPVPVYVDPRRA